MKKEIKNNEVMNAVENTEVKNIEIEPIMDEAQMKQYVEENMHIVPKNQRNKFESMTLDQKVSKISFYYDMQKLREEARIKNSIPNKVKEMFEKRGHYYVEIIMNDNTIYRYKLWSSGPWNNITSLDTCD